jgi:flagellar basal-body rod protein FlgC
MSVYSIALSGLVAQTRAVGAYAQNIANLHSSGRVNPGPGERGAYAPIDPVTISTGAGVRTDFRVVDPPQVKVYSPDSADANDDGLIAVPNISLEEQLVGTMLAKNAYVASAKILGVQRDLDRELLDIIS